MVSAHPVAGLAPLKRLVPAGVAAALLLAGVEAVAMGSPPFANGWPDTEALPDVRGREVTFPSSSPFTIADLPGEPTTAAGTLFMPEASSRSERHPAVVMLHGAGGVLDRREMTYARQLAQAGVAALVVDAFASRRDRANGFVERLIEITETMLVADAYAALRFLASRGDIDAGRVALIGFSYGAMAAIFAAYEQVAEAVAPGGLRFAGHVSFYGPCLARFRDPRTTGAPVLMMSGADDAIVDPVRCAEIKGDLEKGGSDVRMVVFDGAYHQWDGAFDGPFMIGRNLAECRLAVGRDGSVHDLRTHIPMIGPFTRKVILGLCADDEGYLIGRDDAVREKSNRELAAFLARIFR